MLLFVDQHSVLCHEVYSKLIPIMQYHLLHFFIYGQQTIGKFVLDLLEYEEILNTFCKRQLVNSTTTGKHFFKHIGIHILTIETGIILFEINNTRKSYWNGHFLNN